MTIITFDNYAGLEVKHRIQRAWATFKKYRDIFCKKHVGIRRRLALLDRFVRPALLYCWGCLNVTKDYLKQLRGVQNTMHRIMLGWRAPEGWDVNDYMAVVGGKLKRMREKYDIVQWDEAALRTTFNWAGHVGRMSFYSQDRLVVKTLKHKGIFYLRNLEGVFGSQCHGRKFRTWRWERPFYKYFGDDWWERCRDKEGWDDAFNSWLAWRRVLI